MLPSIVGAVQATQPYVVRIIEPPAAVPINIGDVIVSALGAVGVATIAAVLLGGGLAFGSSTAGAAITARGGPHAVGRSERPPPYVAAGPQTGGGGEPCPVVGAAAFSLYTDRHAPA